jgi:DNA-binding NtrC family response regulator
MDGRIAKRKVYSVVETLLLVDGEAAARNALKFLLELNGYRVVEATHGIGASRLLEQYGNRIHLALCAVDLPDMSGPEWLGHTRIVAPELPVLILKDWERMEAALAPVGPWYGGLPARAPAPVRLLERIRLALDEHFFEKYRPSPAA